MPFTPFSKTSLNDIIPIIALTGPVFAIGTPAGKNSFPILLNFSIEERSKEAAIINKKPTSPSIALGSIDFNISNPKVLLPKADRNPIIPEPICFGSAGSAPSITPLPKDPIANNASTANLPAFMVCFIDHSKASIPSPIVIALIAPNKISGPISPSITNIPADIAVTIPTFSSPPKIFLYEYFEISSIIFMFISIAI